MALRYSARLFILAIAIGALLIPSASFAQNDGKRWGASVSFGPTLESAPWYTNLFIAGAVDALKVSEFSVGVTRGQMLGGDWSISFVQKPFKPDTSLEQVEEYSDAEYFARSSLRQVYQHVRMRGVEYQRFIPFVTIKKRVQVGMTAGIGAAFVDGDIVETSESYSRFTLDGKVMEETRTDSATSPAKEVLFPVQLLFKVEATAALVVAPGLKIKFSGGYNSPGTGIRLGAVYLIGAR